jgi:hypothetical protein
MPEQPERPVGLDDYPSQFVPVAFADGISSANWGSGVVKFYLTRYDPHLRAGGQPKEQVVGQVIMPIRGFVAAASFAQRLLNAMINDGTISKEMLEELSGIGNDARDQSSS